MGVGKRTHRRLPIMKLESNGIVAPPPPSIVFESVDNAAVKAVTRRLILDPDASKCIHAHFVDRERRPFEHLLCT